MRWCTCIPAALLLSLAALLPTYGQDIVVRASVDNTTVGLEENVIYSLEVDGASFSDVTTPEPPPVSGLALLQRTPAVQRNMSIVNGLLRQSVTFRWTFRPSRRGEARFDVATVMVNDTLYSTDPITINVVDQAQRPNQQASRQQWPFVLPSRPQVDEDEERGLQTRSLFIRAVPSTTTARQNEQVTIEYQLFFRDGIQLRHSRLAGSWDAEGFWREEFEVDARPIPRSVVENGILYHTIVLKRVAVFPTRPGTLTIDPLEIETEAFVPSGSGDPFERFFSRQFQTVELSSEPVRLRVQPLPGGAPPSFSGAVGSYTLDAAISQTSLEVGEPLELTVTVRGTGNVATLAGPDVDPPGIFEQYDPDVESAIDRTGRRIRGTKTFHYVLVPRSNGSFEMPPIRLAYYDPNQGRYVEVSEALPTVRVTGSASPLVSGTTSEGLPIDDIAPIMNGGSEWHAVAETPLYRRVWPYAALGLPACLLLVVFGVQRRSDRFNSDPHLARSRMAHPLARKHLRQAQRLLANERPRAFYEEIERAVSVFVGNRLDIAETGLTRDRLDAELSTVGVDVDDRLLLRRLLDECDQARFAPVLPDRGAMESARERAAHVIVAVDEAATHHHTGTATT